MQALKFKGELLVIDSQAIHDSGIEIANVYGIAGDVVAPVIGVTVDSPAFDATASEPHAKAATVVIPPRAQFALAVGSPAELAAPDHQCIVK